LARAARLAQVDLGAFLAGPTADPPLVAGVGPGTDAAQHAVSTARAVPSQPRAKPRDLRDSVVALVLTTHAKHDRPMRFEEIVDLCGGRVTRTQISEASAHLCRAGHLDRICDGVYQWAGGARQRSQSSDAPAQPYAPTPQFTGAGPAQTAPSTLEPVDELFARLFPDGIRMTPQLLRDLQAWADLTRTLAAHATS